MLLVSSNKSFLFTTNFKKYIHLPRYSMILCIKLKYSITKFVYLNKLNVIHYIYFKLLFHESFRVNIDYLMLKMVIQIFCYLPQHQTLKILSTSIFKPSKKFSIAFNYHQYFIVLFDCVCNCSIYQKFLKCVCMCEF